MTDLGTNAMAFLSAAMRNAAAMIAAMFIHTNSASECDDFVESNDEYVIEESVESVKGHLGYKTGLYYATHIGEVLFGTYRIEHKLGHGRFSIVWMAHDIHEKRDVALKIMVSGSAGEYEYIMQQEIVRNVRDTPNILTFLSIFSFLLHLECLKLKKGAASRAWLVELVPLPFKC
jgi:serine/threonine protein kinase